VPQQGRGTNALADDGENNGTKRSKAPPPPPNGTPQAGIRQSHLQRHVTPYKPYQPALQQL